MSSPETQRKSLAEVLSEQFKKEAVNTRKALERVPFDKADWAPHEKSMTLGRLAGHIAEMGGMGYVDTHVGGVRYESGRR